MKKLICILLVLTASVHELHAQTDFVPRVTEKGHLINQYDEKGKKHGFWEAYVDEYLKKVKKKEDAAFIVMEYYAHGSIIWGAFYFDHSRKFFKTNQSSFFYRGDPKPISGTMTFEMGKYSTDQIRTYEFDDGYPQIMKIERYDYLSKKDEDYDYSYNKHSFISEWDFTQTINDIEGSYHYKYYKDYELENAYAVYPKYGRWLVNSECGMCTAFTDSTITLNGVTWAKSNLKVALFRNGDEIYFAENVEDFERCMEEKIPAYSDFKGYRTYNWYALNDPRGLVPEGWRLPNDFDFKELRTFLGPNHVDFLKSSTNVEESRDIGYNMSGFDGTSKNSKGPWWSLDADNGEHAHAWMLGDDALKYEKELQCTFYAVRCIKED
jgi:uncharacterized protein (TIGR02145 family)